MKHMYYKGLLALCVAAAILFISHPLDVRAQQNDEIVVQAVGDNEQNPIDITGTGKCDEVLVKADQAAWIKYTATETAEMAIGLSWAEKNTSPCSLALTLKEGENTLLTRSCALEDEKEVNICEILEKGKTYSIKLENATFRDQYLKITIKKNTLTYEAVNNDVTVKPGAEAEFYIKGAKSSLGDDKITYQWYGLNTKASWHYEKIEGATGSAYQVEHITADTMKKYHCIISDGEVSYTEEFKINVRSYLSTQGNQTVYATVGSQVTLDPRAISESEIEITYQWSLENADGSATQVAKTIGEPYTFTMTDETTRKYWCRVWDGYMGITVYFTVCVPDTQNETELELDKSITLEKGETACYTFSPQKDGFYKNSGNGTAAVLDRERNRIYAYRSVGSGYYLRADQKYYISLIADDTREQTYKFSLQEEKVLEDNIVKAECREGRMWTFDTAGVLRYSGQGRLNGIGINDVGAENVKKIIYEEGVTDCGDIGQENLWYHKCSNLTKVVFASSVTGIGQALFQGCSSLKEVEVAPGSKLRDVGKKAFDGTPYLAEQQNAEIVRLADVIIAYHGTAASITISDGVTALAQEAMKGNQYLENVILEEGVEKIGAEAFLDCASLKKITIPRSVTTVGDYAIGYVTIDKNGNYRRNETSPTIACYYMTPGYSYAKKEGISYEILDAKDLSAGAPLVDISYQVSAGKLKQITVRFAEIPLTQGKDYTVDFSDDGKQYTLVVKGIGEYFGTLTLTGAGHTHFYQKISTIRTATAVQTGSEIWGCECGQTITKSIPKLKATGKVTASRVTLQIKKSVTLRVTKLAAGDSVKSWSSKNKKIATVTRKGKVTAKKAGKTKLIVTLASGKKLTVELKVTKGIVKTTKLKINKKSLTLKKNKKYSLKSTVTPFNSQEKVTYQSSNKKVAAVNSKGVVKGIKRGTAVITVRSGKKKVTCKVRVK